MCPRSSSLISAWQSLQAICSSTVSKNKSILSRKAHASLQHIPDGPLVLLPFLLLGLQ